jgi:hypothetical protein
MAREVGFITRMLSPICPSCIAIMIVTRELPGGFDGGGAPGGPAGVGGEGDAGGSGFDAASGSAPQILHLGHSGWRKAPQDGHVFIIGPRP